MKAQNYYSLRNFMLDEMKKEENVIQMYLTKFSQNIKANCELFFHDLMEAVCMKELYSDLESHLEQTMCKEEIETYLTTQILTYSFSSSTNEIKSINEKIKFKMLKHFANILTAKLKTLNEF